MRNCLYSLHLTFQALDSAVQKDLPWVTEAVMDKNYMGQLVAVQHQRGAKGGEIFADALNLNLANHRKVQKDISLISGQQTDFDAPVVALCSHELKLNV